VQSKDMPSTAMWSSDGQWIYFSSVDGGDWDIFRIHPDGSGMENLTADWPSNELVPALQW
jgi:Tol biopolymer transport system component